LVALFIQLSSPLLLSFASLFLTHSLRLLSLLSSSHRYLATVWLKQVVASMLGASLLLCLAGV
jgi:hypothetical protein